MAKYFLGSVGKAEAFRMVDGELKLAFVSKTLTDSGLNISTTKDDIRGGTGAPIQFSFYHDTNVEINLTDIQWKKEYLEAQLGIYLEGGDEKSIDYFTETLIADANNEVTLTRDVKPIPVPCLEEDPYLVWYATKGSDEWTSINIGKDGKKISGLKAGATYCVRYLAEESKAISAEVTSLIVPQELFLIITAPIFAGDACAATKGEAAGHITFEVPRFQLNGAQEFSMNMSSNQTMSLAGIALASESLSCEQDGGKLLRIIEVINDRNIYEGISEMVADTETIAVGSVPLIYGVNKYGTQVEISNADLTFAPALDADGGLASLPTTATLSKAKTGLATDTVLELVEY